MTVWWVGFIQSYVCISTNCHVITVLYLGSPTPGSDELDRYRLVVGL